MDDTKIRKMMTVVVKVVSRVKMINMDPRVWMDLFLSKRRIDKDNVYDVRKP